MNQFLDEFSVWLEMNEGRSVRTVTKYRGHLDVLSRYMADRGLTVATVASGDLADFTGLFLHEQGLRPRSRRPAVSAVRKFFAWLVRTGRRPDNPASDLPHPAAGRPLPVPMETRYAEQLLMAPGLDTFLGRRDTAILSLFIGCGLRAGGLARLNESDLLFYADEQNRGRERLAVRVTEKGDRQRIVPAPDECWALVRAYLGDQALDDIDRTLPDGDRALFVSVNNRNVTPDKYHGEERRLSVRSIQDMVMHHGKAAGIPASQLHPHAMRHLYGTELAEQDVDLLVRQALMGHRNSSSTEIYTHLAQRKLREAVDKASPFRRIRTPVSELVKELRKG